MQATPLPEPPPLPPHKPRQPIRPGKWTFFLFIIFTLPVVAFIALRACGLVRPFSIPTNGMAPTIARGDMIVMENFTYHSRKPRRGDLAVFKTDDIHSLSPGSIFVQRVAGEPGDHLQVSEGRLRINGETIVLSGSAGEITYLPPTHLPGKRPGMNAVDVMVPEGGYFMLGDNSSNSLDSRYWGCVPEANIIGCISYRVWPPDRAGKVK